MGLDLGSLQLLSFLFWGDFVVVDVVVFHFFCVFVFCFFVFFVYLLVCWFVGLLVGWGCLVVVLLLLFLDR